MKRIGRRSDAVDEDRALSRIEWRSDAVDDGAASSRIEWRTDEVNGGAASSRIEWRSDDVNGTRTSTRIEWRADPLHVPPEPATAATTVAVATRTTSRVPLVLLAVGFVLSTVLATFVAGGTRYVQDTSFEFDWNPAGLFAKYLSVWDASRGLGDANPSFDTVLSVVSAVLREAGFGPAVSQRLVHTLLLSVAGLGAVMVLRRWRPKIGPEHVAMGLAYMFNPFTATFLFPATLFLNYALAPWFLFAFLVGVQAARRWRWAAVFALLVFAAGWSNAPGLAWSMLPLPVAALYLVYVERSTTWRQVGAWVVRAGVLTVPVCVAGLVKASAGSSSLQTNLAESETPSAISLASSWSETWRGLGFWLSYWINERGPSKPQTADYLVSVPLVLAAFAVPVAALLTFWHSRWRPRIFFAALILIALPIMVGAYPIDAPSPLGRFLLDVYDAIPPLYGFRNTYKAGPALLLGVAGLLAVAATAIFARASRRHRGVVVAGIACVAGLVLWSFPFWTGDVYARPGMSEVPTYYRSAISWLDDQPGSGRALILPGSGFTVYRWGSPGDDIFDALMERTNVASTLRPRSAPESANLVNALYDVLDSGSDPEGAVPQILGRLGIEYVVVRNDLDWQLTNSSRPVVLDALRRDRGLQLARSFGAPGKNVVAPGDDSPDAEAERALPPVEVYRVAGGSPVVDLRPADAQLLVSGDGEAWPTLATNGALDGRTVRYTGDLDATQLRAALDDGAPLVVTDTNRRRQGVLGAIGARPGPTLTARESPARGVASLFGAAGSQTVLARGDVDSITTSGLLGFTPSTVESRIENAFDGDPATSWLTAPLVDELGQTIHIEFSRPVELRQAAIVVASPCCTGRVVSAASLHLPNGEIVPIDLRSGRADVQFTPRTVRSVDVRIDGVQGEGSRPIGFSEISLAGISLQPFTQVPDDVFRAADRSPALAKQLAAAPVTYQFTPDLGAGTADARLRRLFRTEGARSFAVDGSLALSTNTSDAVIDRLLGRSIGAVGSSRSNGRVENSGARAVDGRLDTSWSAVPERDQALQVRFATKPVTSVEVDVEAGANSSPITALDVRVGDTTVPVGVSPPPDGCVTDAPCTVTARVAVPATDASDLSVSVAGVEPRGGSVGLQPMRIAEVRINGHENSVLADDAALASCVDTGMTVDGAPLLLSVTGATGELLASKPVPFSVCGEVALDSGRHRLDSGNQLPVARMSLASGAAAPAVLSTGATARVLDDGSDSERVEVTVPRGGADLVVSRAFDERWTASADGRDLGPAIAADTQLSWHLDRPGTYVVELAFPPQHTFRIALLVTLAGLLLCVLLLFVEPRARRARTTTRRGKRPRDALVIAATMVAAFVAGGIPGAIVAVGGLVAARVASARFVALAAALALVVAALATVFEAGLDLGPGFASNRPVAAAAGLAAGVLLLVAVVESARTEAPDDDQDDQSDRRAYT